DEGVRCFRLTLPVKDEQLECLRTRKVLCVTVRLRLEHLGEFRGRPSLIAKLTGMHFFLSCTLHMDERNDSDFGFFLGICQRFLNPRFEGLSNSGHCCNSFPLQSCD